MRYSAGEELRPRVRQAQRGSGPCTRHPYKEQWNELQHPIRQRHGIPQEHSPFQLSGDPQAVCGL